MELGNRSLILKAFPNHGGCNPPLPEKTHLFIEYFNYILKSVTQYNIIIIRK